MISCLFILQYLQMCNYWAYNNKIRSKVVETRVRNLFVIEDQNLPSPPPQISSDQVVLPRRFSGKCRRHKRHSTSASSASSALACLNFDMSSFLKSKACPYTVLLKYSSASKATLKFFKSIFISVFFSNIGKCSVEEIVNWHCLSRVQFGSICQYLRTWAP